MPMALHAILLALRTSVVGRALVALLTAVVYRLRGGGFIAFGRTQVARATWMAMMLLTAGLHAQVPWWSWGGLVPALAFVALIASGHGDHQDLGRMPAGYSKDGKPYEVFTWPFRALIRRSDGWGPRARELFDAALMSWIGFWRGVVVGLGVVCWDPVAALQFVLGNSLMGLAYWLGYRVPWTLPGLHARSTEWGELFTGLFVGAAFLVPRTVLTW